MKLKPIAMLMMFGMGLSAAAYGDDVSDQINNLQAQINQLQSQVGNSGSASGNMVGVNSSLSSAMLSNYSGVGKEMNLLKARQMNQPMLVVGGKVQGDAAYYKSNTDGAFYSPLADNVAGTNKNQVNQIYLSNVNADIVANINSWTAAYVQFGQSAVGNSLATAFGINQAYLLFGNLNNSPVYGFAGKKDIDFGSFATVDMYSQPLTRGEFMATGNTVGVGYAGYGFNGTVSAMNGGTQMNTVSVSNVYQYQNMVTQNTNNINNYAINLSYNYQDMLNFGAGYLNGSSETYINNGQTQNNGAWDLNAKLSMYNFDVLAEYAATVHPLVSGGAKVQTWQLGADYNLPQIMGMNDVVSAEYSALRAPTATVTGVATSAGTGTTSQYVVGYRVQPFKAVWTGLEYAYNTSGSNFPVTGTPVSATSAHNNTVLLDVTAMF